MGIREFWNSTKHSACNLVSCKSNQLIIINIKLNIYWHTDTIEKSESLKCDSSDIKQFHTATLNVTPQKLPAYTDFEKSLFICNILYWSLKGKWLFCPPCSGISGDQTTPSPTLRHQAGRHLVTIFNDLTMGLNSQSPSPSADALPLGQYWYTILK